MCIHFNTRQAAIAHLTANGWKEIKTGRFISRDGSCVARLDHRFADVVMVVIWSL